MKLAGSLQNGKGGMPFIQVTNLRLDAQGHEQSPSADAEEHFLLQAQFRSAAIKFAGDSPMRRKVCRVVTIEQIKLHPADLDLPGAEPNRVSRQGDLQAQPFAVGFAQQA